jgi:hypothetical protein
MSPVKGMLAVGLAPLALGLGVMGMIDGSIESADATQKASQTIRCNIQVEEHGRSVALEGVVFAKSAIEGSYQLRVSKTGGAGSSDITQSGSFSAGPDAPATLGSVTLGGDGGSYVAKLTVMWNGRSIECTERACRTSAARSPTSGPLPLPSRCSIVRHRHRRYVLRAGRRSLR